MNAPEPGKVYRLTGGDAPSIAGGSTWAEAEVIEPQEWNRPLAERVADVAAERETEAEADPFAVGSIFYTSWGYDQTNVEYVQVVRATKASVWVVPMSSEVRDGRLYPGTTTGIATPSMHRKGGKDTPHPYLRLDDVRHAWPYTGGGRYDTRAAGQPGH